MKGIDLPGTRHCPLRSSLQPSQPKLYSQDVGASQNHPSELKTACPAHLKLHVQMQQAGNHTGRHQAGMGWDWHNIPHRPLTRQQVRLDLALCQQARQRIMPSSL